VEKTSVFHRILFNKNEMGKRNFFVASAKQPSVQAAQNAGGDLASSQRGLSASADWGSVLAIRAIPPLRSPRAAFGGHPHQSKIGSEEPIFDSFSLEGEAFGGNFHLVQ
jgi:hypothetical protein